MPLLSLTVPSYYIFKSYKAFTNFLCKYPMLDVLTAVSERPYLPAMAWKKNS